MNNLNTRITLPLSSADFHFPHNRIPSFQSHHQVKDVYKDPYLLCVLFDRFPLALWDQLKQILMVSYPYLIGT